MPVLLLFEKYLPIMTGRVVRLCSLSDSPWPLDTLPLSTLNVNLRLVGAAYTQ